MLRTITERPRMKPAEFIHVLDHPEAPPLVAHDAASELLLTLLAKMFFADRLAGDVADSRSYVEELAARPLALDALAEAFPDAQDRDDIITLAEHAVWGDGRVDAREWDWVDQLVEVLGVVRP
jgi:hypothetical protein